MVFYADGNPLNSVTKQVTNRNNRFIPYIENKTLRNKKNSLFILSSLFVGIETLDPDRSYLVNYFFFVNRRFFILSFVLLNDQTIGSYQFLSCFVTHF